MTPPLAALGAGSRVTRCPGTASSKVLHSAAFRASPSELSDVTARLLYGCVQVKPVGPASSRSKRGQSLRGTVEEPISSNPICASRVRHGHTDLRKPLPQISFLNRPRLPTGLQHLVGGERTACLHERSSCFKCLLGRQGLFRHRLHPRSAVRQGPAQSVARPGLTSAAYGVPVTITPSHTTSLSSGGTGCAEERQSAARAAASNRRQSGRVIPAPLGRVARVGSSVRDHRGRRVARRRGLWALGVVRPRPSPTASTDGRDMPAEPNPARLK